MTYLYNCKHDGDQYRITKFDSDFNVESSYLCTTSACQCPAGVRPMCRHREMLPRFINRGTVGTDWFYDYDRGGWVQNEMPVGNITATEVEQRMANLEGPANPIAEALVDATIEIVQAIPKRKRRW